MGKHNNVSIKYVAKLAGKGSPPNTNGNLCGDVIRFIDRLFPFYLNREIVSERGRTIPHTLLLENQNRFIDELFITILLTIDYIYPLYI